ncbi:MAG: SEL1-like repeat protein, partial [Proteobacteria bacterium]|nr:SEL1-like repeat protein [Pseudomonadota bacterium]
AACGIVSAQYNLGVLYDSGRGVEADPVEALIWFHSAAEKGHGRAQYALAAAYAAGRGIARDSDMALKWLRRAASENILEAQSSLANILATSPVSHDSLKEAYYWYRLADANGDGKAADKAELVAARLTQEERADASRRVSAFIAENITGKRQRTQPPAPPVPPVAAPIVTPGADATKAATPSIDAQITAIPAGVTSDSARIRTIQALLTKLGFETGPADGSLDTQTRDAIRNYQRALGLDIDGEPSEALLAHLRQISGTRQ